MSTTITFDPTQNSPQSAIIPVATAGNEGTMSAAQAAALAAISPGKLVIVPAVIALSMSAPASIPLAGAAVGMKVLFVLNLTAISAQQFLDSTALVESTISVAGHIQQTSPPAGVGVVFVLLQGQ